MACDQEVTIILHTNYAVVTMISSYPNLTQHSSLGTFTIQLRVGMKKLTWGSKSLVLQWASDSLH